MLYEEPAYSGISETPPMGSAKPRVRLKRVYEPADAGDGLRVLVDRLWPRGIRKDDAMVARWMKDIAPSSELRIWFAHDPARWDEFRRRYRAELAANADSLIELRTLARTGPLTLVYSARGPVHNHAVVLRDALMGGSWNDRAPPETD